MLNFQIKSNADTITLPFSEELKLKKELLEESAEIVRKDIQDNIDKGLDIYGGALAPNKSKTRILFRTGELFNSIAKIIQGNTATIFVQPGRDTIGKYLNWGTDKMVSRNFFKSETEISPMSLKKIGQLLSSKTFSQLFEK